MQIKKELMALNNTYRKAYIDAYTYIRKARILNAKIHHQEENLDTHDHMH